MLCSTERFCRGDVGRTVPLAMAQTLVRWLRGQRGVIDRPEALLFGGVFRDL